MMSFGLIVLVTFVLAIIGVHIWCRLSELQDQAHARRASSSPVVDQEVIETTVSAV
jgi:hypothetical protein